MIVFNHARPLALLAGEHSLECNKMTKQISIKVSGWEDLLSGERSTQVVCAMQIPDKQGMSRLDAIEELVKALATECRGALEAEIRFSVS